MRLLRRHNENISGFADMLRTVYGELTDAIDHMNHRIAGGIVRADLLAFGEREQCQADRLVLGESLADDLTRCCCGSESARFKTVSWSIFLIKAIFLFPFRPDLTMIRLLNWISLAGFQGQRSFCGQTCIRVLTFAPWDHITAILPRYLPFVCCKYNIFSSACQFQGAILVNHHD